MNHPSPEQMNSQRGQSAPAQTGSASRAQTATADRARQDSALSGSGRPLAEAADPGRGGEQAAILWVGLGLVAVILGTLVAYSPVLFNFFAGDDFVHLTWLSQAVHNPELIWRNFHSSWLDGTTTRFYRPLISVFMVSDYLLWGVNGLGFRLTNLICHLASSLFLFLIVAELGRQPGQTSAPGIPGRLTWALLAAALFALYPLHAEAVSWITGRVDSVVTVFCLASILSYMRWRTSGRLPWLIAAFSAMVLALLSKEMAVTLPAVFLSYDLLLGRSRARAEHFLPRLVSGLAHTACFWLLLAGYFVLRRAALGTFVGGYDDSLFFISNWAGFLGGWLHAVRMLLVPINRELLGAHHVLTKLWEASLAACLVLAAVTVWKRRDLWPACAFLSIWLLLSLLPVYKIFAIADDLEGSRLAYLATAPLAALMALVLAGWSGSRSWSRLRPLPWLTAVTLTSCAGLLLWANNQAWSHAGHESNAIRRGLDRIYRSLPGDPQVLFVGLPDQVNGAYICRNALWGMTKYPQLHRDIVNAIMVDRFEPILPFGHLKQSLGQSRDQVRIYSWQADAQEFQPIALTTSPGPQRYPVWQGARLKEVLKPIASSSVSFSWRPDGALEVKGGTGVRGRPQLLLNLGDLPCFSVDFVGVSLRALPPQATASAAGADLLYANDLNPLFDLKRRTHSRLLCSGQDQTLVFPLHSLADWTLGGSCRGLKLLLPDNCHLAISSVELIPPEAIMPVLRFPNSGYLGSKGYLHLSQLDRSQVVTVDARHVPGAAAIQIEITRPNLLFDSQNTAEPCSVIMERLEVDTAYGALTLRRERFPSAGIYEARARAIDAHGEPIGVAGDHIVISVDN